VTRAERPRLRFYAERGAQGAPSREARPRGGRHPWRRSAGLSRCSSLRARASTPAALPNQPRSSESQTCGDAQRVRDLSPARSAAIRAARVFAGRASTGRRAPARGAKASTRSPPRRTQTGEHLFQDIALWTVGAPSIAGGIAAGVGLLSAIPGIGGGGGPGGDSRPGGGMSLGGALQRGANVANVGHQLRKVLGAPSGSTTTDIPPAPGSGTRITGGQGGPTGVWPNAAAPGGQVGATLGSDMGADGLDSIAQRGGRTRPPGAPVPGARNSPGLRPAGNTANPPRPVPGRVSGPPRGFGSHDALVRHLGPAGPEMHWHHIVLQTPSNVQRFGPQAVHNTSNVARISRIDHIEIHRFYEKPNPRITGSQTLSVREWIGARPFEAQRQFGDAVLKIFTGIK
jgi:hypothetical protein